MAQFQEVLEEVRSALTSATPAQLWALLRGLVEEGIISEAYSRSLTPEPLDGELEEELDGCFESGGPGWDRVSAQVNQLGLREQATADKHYLPTQTLSRGSESLQACGRDSERVKKGNLEAEKEWLEEVARRIAVPLWQHWDRGRRMLLPLLPCLAAACPSGENTPCSALDEDEEAQLAASYRTLDVTDDISLCTELDFMNVDLSLDPGAGLSMDPFRSFGAVTNKLQGHEDVCWTDDGTDDSDHLCVFTADTLGITEYLETFSRTMCSMEADAGDEVDSLWDAKMQEVEPDIIIPSDFGDLPDDLSEYLDDNYLNTDVLLGDPWFNSTDDQISDFSLLTEAPDADSPQQRYATKLSEKTKTRGKRQRDRSSQLRPDETPRSKRQKAPGKPKTKEAQSEPASGQGSESSPAKTVRGHATTPQRILHIYPSHSASPIPIQFITLPDAPGYQVVRLSPPPPVIRLPLPNTAASPTYILVPTSSPPSARQLPPLSPVDGAVAPVQMSSSPPGSLSDTASKAMSPPCASPLSPVTETSPCKDSPSPQSPAVPPVLELPQAVKDFIQENKAHVSQSCQEMEEGLSLSSHYVEVNVNQREVLRSGKNTNKNTNKCLDKDLVIKGDTDRLKSSLGPSQIFEGSAGDKAKRYVLLFGNAGMGKTTLIRKLCLDWSRDALPQFDFVFLLDGKGLRLTEPVYSLQTLLLSVSSLASSCLDPEAVYAQITAAPKRVLIIFDGFDELRDYETLLQTQEKDLVTSLQRDSRAQSFTVRQLYAAVLQRILLPGCTLLLSARPRGSANQLLRRADSFLEVCGFTPTHVETYLSQYFSDPVLRASALDLLRSSSYLRLLCWNPGLCRLVCLVLEQCSGLDVLPRTLTGLCHEVLRLKMEKDGKRTPPRSDAETPATVKESQPEISNSSQVKRKQRSQRGRRTKQQDAQVDTVDEETAEGVVGEAGRSEDTELLAQLSSLAWDGVKANSTILPPGPAVSARLQEFGLRLGLLLSHPLRTTRPSVPRGEKTGGGGGERKDAVDVVDSHILLWANPFLQSYMAAVHLSLSRAISDRAFLQNLPFQLGSKGRRRPQREELELTQRQAVGLLFHNRTELQRLHSLTETSCRDMLLSKQALVLKHMEGLSYGDLSPSQLLEACHYVYEASFTHDDSSRVAASARLLSHLAANLPEELAFRGVPLSPPDVFTVQHALDRARKDGRSFSLDVEDSGIQISGLRSLVGLSNINTYRACIADVITLWEQLEQDEGEDGLLQGAVSKFKIHPLKATQVCHVEHLAKLVNIHVHKRISDSSSQSDSILADGVPAVKELHKLEFELGPDHSPLALPQLWELLPGLHNLQHLDLDNSKIGDEGAEKLASALVSLSSLEILTLSQNCIGDQGVIKLSSSLRELPRLHCLSLYSNVISDEGAESLAAVLPHMASLTDLDVKYNKLTDVGAQSLGASLKNCKRIKSLRMWNQCIPYGVFERLQQQDSRIVWQ